MPLLVIEVHANSENSNWKKSSQRGMVSMSSSPLRSLPLPALLLGLSLGGCLTGKSTIGLLDGDTGTSTGSSNGDDESSSSSSEGSTTTSPGSDDAPGDSSEASSGGEPVACPAHSGCTFAADCNPVVSGATCGGILGRANDDGCPRPYCSGPGECAAGSSCFLPWSWGTCGPHACYDDDAGACECTFGLDCNNDGLCVPDEEGLPPDTNATDFCGQHTDAAACEGSGLPAELGLCLWYEGWQMPEDGACEERVAVGRCTFSRATLSGGIEAPTCPGDDSLTPLAYVDDGTVTVLFVDPQDPPTALEMDLDMDSYGWLGCDLPEVADACACACS